MWMFVVVQMFLGSFYTIMVQLLRYDYVKVIIMQLFVKFLCFIL